MSLCLIVAHLLLDMGLINNALMSHNTNIIDCLSDEAVAVFVAWHDRRDS